MKDWKTLDADKVRILNKHFTAGRAGEHIQFVVVHHNSGTLTTEGCYEVWQTREASAHYQVEKDGTIGQLVWDKDTAWHAANLTANRRSIGVEHANASSTTSPISDATLDNGAHLVAAICVKYGLGRPRWMVNVFPHKHFHDTDCPGHIAGDQNAEYMARAQKYYDEMTGTKPVSASSSVKVVTVKDGVEHISLSELEDGIKRGVATDSMRIVQRLLNRSGHTKAAGYPDIVIDGLLGAFGSRTRRAYAHFQKFMSDTSHLGWGPADTDGVPGPLSVAALAEWGKVPLTK